MSKNQALPFSIISLSELLMCNGKSPRFSVSSSFDAWGDGGSWSMSPPDTRWECFSWHWTSLLQLASCLHINVFSLYLEIMFNKSWIIIVNLHMYDWEEFIDIIDIVFVTIWLWSYLLTMVESCPGGQARPGHLLANCDQ